MFSIIILRFYVIFHCSVDEKPTLQELLHFPTVSGDTINITEKVGKKYADLGIFLLEDNDETIVDQIVSNCRGQASDIIREILKRWVRGQGRQPVTWKTLIEVLNIIKLTELASSIQTALSSQQSSSPQ